MFCLPGLPTRICASYGEVSDVVVSHALSLVKRQLNYLPGAFRQVDLVTLLVSPDCFCKHEPLNPMTQLARSVRAKLEMGVRRPSLLERL
jgi:hypothetical protein